MTPDKDIHKRIDDYLNNSLNEVENQAFEAQLAEDAALKEQVELIRIANKVVLKNRLWEVQELTRQRLMEGKKSRTRQNWLTGLASLAIICGGISYYVLTNKKAPEEVSKSVNNTPVTPQSFQETTPTSISVPEPEVKTPIISSFANRTKNETNLKAASSASEETELKIQKPAASVSNEDRPARHSPVSKLTEEQSIAELEDACAKTKIDAVIQASGTCSDQNEGTISLSKFSGGTKPYKVRILDEKRREHSAVNLPSGTFSVEISDNKGCTSIQEGIIIKEEICRKDFELNPDNGDIWDFGISANPVAISVYDQSENLYFYKKFEMGETIKWNGMSLKGEVLPGYYLFVLKYQDGKTVSGSFTIVR